MNIVSRDRSLAALSQSVLLVGAGRMGGALLQGWLDLGLDPSRLTILEPQPAPDIAAMAARGVSLNPPGNTARDVVLLAVKPQVAADLLPRLTGWVGAETLVVSIMAGRSIGSIATAFPSAAIVRAMPNTPASIGRGITVAVGNRAVSPGQREVAHALLAACGRVEWVEDEALLDPVTAVSGSGPAYVFLLAECLATAGVAAGLSRDLAEKLARETVSGAGELLHRSPLDPATLRQNVTSPAGTTAAALNVLMASDGLEPLMRRAVAAATKRSRELGG